MQWIECGCVGTWIVVAGRIGIVANHRQRFRFTGHVEQVLHD